MLGPAVARQRGAIVGRPRGLSFEEILEGHRHVVQSGISIWEAARRLDVCHATLVRGFKWVGLEAIQ